MDQFKKAQEIAKKTQAMQQELAAIEMVGSGAGGGVKCVMNGQQKPLKIEFDDEYYGSADAATTSADVMAAMNDAHEKSIKVRELGELRSAAEKCELHGWRDKRANSAFRSFIQRSPFVPRVCCGSP